MPGCMLVVTGRDLDLNWIAANCTLSATRTWRCGEPRIGKSQRVCEENGIKFEVSGADGRQVPVQIREAQEFLEVNKNQIQQLLIAPGFGQAILDFGWTFPIATTAGQWNVFPASFLGACSALGIGICVSVYASSDA